MDGQYVNTRPALSEIFGAGHFSSIAGTVGNWAALYRQRSVSAPDLLSVHPLVGLSGTVNAAQARAGIIPETNTTVVDTKDMLSHSGAAGGHGGASAKDSQSWLHRLAAMLALRGHI